MLVRQNLRKALGPDSITDVISLRLSFLCVRSYLTTFFYGDLTAFSMRARFQQRFQLYFADATDN